MSKELFATLFKVGDKGMMHCPLPTCPIAWGCYGQREESYLANHSTGDLSIQDVVGDPSILRITPTTVDT